MSGSGFRVDEHQGVRVLRLQSDDGTNRLTRDRMLSLTDAVGELARENRPLVVAGNDRFFSAGAELAEISALDGPSAYEFSKMGQALMDEIENPCLHDENLRRDGKIRPRAGVEFRTGGPVSPGPGDGGGAARRAMARR